MDFLYFCAAAVEAAEVPQFGQNFASPDNAVPHSVHLSEAGFPHEVQNLAPGCIAPPHSEQAFACGAPNEVPQPGQNFAAAFGRGVLHFVQASAYC